MSNLSMVASTTKLKCYVCDSDHEVGIKKAADHLNNVMMTENPQAHYRMKRLKPLGLSDEYAFVIAQAGMSLGDNDNAVCEACGLQFGKQELLEWQAKEESPDYYPPLIQHMHYSAKRKQGCRFIQKLMLAAGEKVNDRMDKDDSESKFKTKGFISFVTSSSSPDSIDNDEEKSSSTEATGYVPLNG